MTASSAQPRVPLEEIAGLVERVTFFNPESGFAVLWVHVRGQWDPVTELARSIWQGSAPRDQCTAANVAQEPFGDESPLGDGFVF